MATKTLLLALVLSTGVLFGGHAEEPQEVNPENVYKVSPDENVTLKEIYPPL